jgi:hypothetical protein
MGRLNTMTNVGTSTQMVTGTTYATFFSQSMAICRPYMDDKQVQEFPSRFAMIRGKADFMAIADEGSAT